MRVFDSVIDLIGNTPLVRLNSIVEPGMAAIYAKLENLNPGGSVKDRMALNMVKRAEEKGLIKPGATLVESTSGNTGIGLAITAAVRGYRSIFTMPDKMSKEKIDMLKAYGSKVVVTRTDLSHDHPDSYVEVAKRIARETPNSYYTDQYYNMSNPEAHYLATGPEIWDDMDGNIDCLIGGLGTGGTVSGTARYLKEQAAKVGREVKIICPDPCGSIYKDEFYEGESGESGTYRVEGIGHDFMVGTIDMNVIDEIFNVSDIDSFRTARRLAREEGIFSGGSTGTAVFGALEIARRLGPEKNVVVIISDSGDRYLSKCYNDDWMRDMGFIGQPRDAGTVADLMHFKVGEVEFADPKETLTEIVTRMSESGYSQMPVKVDGEYMMIHEHDLLQSLVNGEIDPSDKVVTAAKTLHGMVTLSDSLSDVQAVFDNNHIAVVMDDDKLTGVITKMDVIEYIAEDRQSVKRAQQ